MEERYKVNLEGVSLLPWEKLKKSMDKQNGIGISKTRCLHKVIKNILLAHKDR